MFMGAFIIFISYFLYSWSNPECQYAMDCDYLYECVSNMCQYRPEITFERCKIK